jgi:hypothetical protein
MAASVAPNNPASSLEWALYYAARGWSVVPVRRGEKVPAIPWAQFQHRRASEAEIRDWFADPSMGIGIVTGAISGIFVVDFDGEEGAATHARLSRLLGPAPTSLTGGGGTHMLFRHPGQRVPTRKGLAPGMDIRGDGGFIVAPPSTHASGRQYAWDVDLHPDDIAIYDAPREFIERICADAPPGPGGIAPVSHAPGPLGLPGAINDGREQYMRNTVLAVARGLFDKHGRLPTEAEVFEEGWPQYRDRVDLSRPGRGEAEFRAKVAYTLARLHRGAIPSFTAPAAGSEPADGQAASGGAGGAVPLWHDPSDPTTVAIPRRPWCAPGYLMRGSVSVLSGQGAGGKSSLVVALSIACARGEPMGAFAPTAPLIVVNYNTEDDQDEQRRRYSAALTAQKLPGDAIRNRVIRCGPHDVGTLFERDAKTGRVTPTPALAALEALVESSGADVLICDPLAELHNAEENDNTAMRAVVAAFRAMAQRLNIAGLILHHDRKGTNAPGDMDRMRGASAITGAVRVMLTLTTMSIEEAEKFGIPADQRRRHFRIDGAKSNYAPAQDAEWWRLDGIEIANGETVAAALPWTPPSAFDGVSMATCVAVLERLRTGTNGCPFGAGGKARGEMFAVFEAEPFNLPKGKLGAMLTAWTTEGLVYEQDGCPSPNSRHARRGLVVDETKIAEMRRQI